MLIRHSACVSLALAFVLLHSIAAAQTGDRAKESGPQPVATITTGKKRSFPTFSPDGSLLATSHVPYGGMFNFTPQQGGQLKLWETATGKQRLSIPDGWFGFVFSPDGQTLASWTATEVTITSTQSGETKAVLKHDNVGRVRFLAKPNWLVTQTRGRDGLTPVPNEIRLWDTKSWRRVETKIDKHMPMYCPVISPDGKHAAGIIVGEPMEGKPPQSIELKLWEVETGKELPAPERAVPDAFYGVGFTRDGSKLVLTDQAGRLGKPRVWDIKQGKLVSLLDHIDLIADVSWSAGGYVDSSRVTLRRKTAKIAQGKLEVREAVSSKKLAEFTLPPKLATATLEGPPWLLDKAIVLRTKQPQGYFYDIWETDNWTRERTIHGAPPLKPLTDKWLAYRNVARVTNDGKTLVALESIINGSKEASLARVIAYDFASGEEKYELRGHNQFVTSLALSPQGSLMATGSGLDQFWARMHGEVMIWNADTGRHVRTVIKSGPDAYCLAFSHDGRRLAVGGRGGKQGWEYRVSLWDTGNSKLLADLAVPPRKKYPQRWDQASALAFSPDGKSLAVGGKGRLSFWDVPEGTLRYLGVTDGSTNGLQFSADNSRLFISAGLLYDIDMSSVSEEAVSRKEIRFTPALGGPEFALNPQGTVIASWGTHNGVGEIRLWDVKKHELIKIISSSPGVRTVSFTPDGKKLVAGGVSPKTLATTLLDPDTGREMATITHQRQTSFSFDGGLFATLDVATQGAELFRHRLGRLMIKRGPTTLGAKLYDSRTGRQLAALPHPGIRLIGFSSDGKTLATTGPESTKLWDVASMRK